MVMPNGDAKSVMPPGLARRRPRPTLIPCGGNSPNCRISHGVGRSACGTSWGFWRDRSRPRGGAARSCAGRSVLVDLERWRDFATLARSVRCPRSNEPQPHARPMERGNWRRPNRDARLLRRLEHAEAIIDIQEVGGPARYSVGDAPRRRRRAMIDAVAPWRRVRLDRRRPARAERVARQRLPTARRSSPPPPAVRRPRSARGARWPPRTPSHARGLAHSALRRPRPLRSTPACSTKRLPLLDPHHVPHPGGRTRRSASGAISCAIRSTKSRSCWRKRPNEVWSSNITSSIGPAINLLLSLRHHRHLQPESSDGTSLDRKAPRCSRRCSNATTKHPAQKAAHFARRPRCVRCEPRPRHCCSPISASPNPTAGRTHPMTTLLESPQTMKFSSRSFHNASAASRMPRCPPHSSFVQSGSSPCQHRSDNQPGALRSGRPNPRHPQITLDSAFSRNPERFVEGPQPPAKPIASINPPTTRRTIQA